MQYLTGEGLQARPCRAGCTTSVQCLLRFQLTLHQTYVWDPYPKRRSQIQRAYVSRSGLEALTHCRMVNFNKVIPGSPGVLEPSKCS